MEQLLQIDGAIEFFLMTATTNVDWHGSSTDIVSDRLTTVAANVNRQFGTDLDCFAVKLTWVKLRSLWETWVRATYYVPPKKVNFSTGEINIDDFAWDQLVRIVPDAEIFRRKKMISPNMVCTVFNRTPPSLAPEEFHLRHLEEAEEKEWKACMDMVLSIDALLNSLEYTMFCMSLFKNREIRRCFDLLPSKTLKYEYVIMQYNLSVASGQL
ncbi:hypothetical protein SO802_017383 [Lithocarpus litseifolius]|uniref:NR LBD domain-containing protein n=1 Tax=Lithocarpus litseifolius TaxID=425828 RepID=A0AAW2CL60_9ROSI